MREAGAQRAALRYGLNGLSDEAPGFPAWRALLAVQLGADVHRAVVARFVQGDDAIRACAALIGDFADWLLASSGETTFWFRVTKPTLWR